MAGTKGVPGAGEVKRGPSSGLQDEWRRFTATRVCKHQIQKDLIKNQLTSLVRTVWAIAILTKKFPIIFERIRLLPTSYT
jgi:hypothetical protein